VDYDFEKATANGTPSPSAHLTNWWAFRSSCSPLGCVAAFTVLDNDTHQTADSAVAVNTGVFRFVNGHWQDTASGQLQCSGAAGADTRTTTVSLEPQPDGSLEGVQTTTVQTNECGNQEMTVQNPVVARRIGDVPAGVTVADPPAN
jgi:serine/threonine protein kinase, bacterial